MAVVENRTEAEWQEFAHWKRVDPTSIFAPCNAPATTMSFQVDGKVFTCSRKPHLALGDITTQTIAEIWEGETARALRQSMQTRTFPAACAPCGLLALSGSPASADLRKYEHLAPPADTTMPRRMEFNLANTCNLECIHCRGILSSRIRARREGLPPLPRLYGDSFFEQLRAFLPHLEECVFLGGEPFLQSECHRIWDDLLQLDRRPRINIATNGTCLDERTERVLSEMDFCLNVSVDGSKRDTIESIRFGAHYAEITTNLERFAELAARPRCELNLSFCPMQLNWHELPDVCAWATRLGAGVRLNYLTDPPHLSMFQMKHTELDEVVERLSSSAQSRTRELGPNEFVVHTFVATIARQRDRLAAADVTDALQLSRRASRG